MKSIIQYKKWTYNKYLWDKISVVYFLNFYGKLSRNKKKYVEFIIRG